MCRRAILGGWILLIALGAASGSSPESARPTDSEAADAVAAIKRDLERIRAAHEARKHGSGNLSGPHIATPELRIESTDAPSASIRVLKPEKNNGNWLIDAMEHNARERNERSRETMGLSRKAEREARGGIEPEDSRPELPFSSGEARTMATEGDLRSIASVPTDGIRASGTNPLSTYLGEWLTPRDYALLRPESAGASVGGTRQVAPFQRGATFELGIKREIPGGLAPATEFPVAGNNPFLESLEQPSRWSLPAVPLAPLPLSGPPRIGSAPETITAPLSRPEVTPPSPRLPDLAKPRPDETYFKQLKRF